MTFELTEANLQSLREPLQNALGAYSCLYDDDLSFQEPSNLTLTPAKPNTARTVVPVRYKEQEAGKMYVIVFSPEDGTGDESTYRLSDLKIPERFKHGGRRVIPRSKEGTLYEGFFPLFSCDSEGNTALFTTCLEELTLTEDKQITSLCRLGSDWTSYKNALETNEIIEPRIQLTVGGENGEDRFGDPHAIYNPQKIPQAVQVAGFLAIKDSRNPLIHLARNWERPEKY